MQHIPATLLKANSRVQLTKRRESKKSLSPHVVQRGYEVMQPSATPEAFLASDKLPSMTFSVGIMFFFTL